MVSDSGIHGYKSPHFKGQSLWRVAKMYGKSRIFETPEELWQQCVRYFKWVEANGLEEEKLFNAKHGLRKGSVTHMRAMTVTGLSVFIGISDRTWRAWSEPENPMYNEALAPMVLRVEQIMREQKFTGAASGMLKGSIIARDLAGLTDRHDAAGPRPVDSEMALEEKAAAFKTMLEDSKSHD